MNFIVPLVVYPFDVMFSVGESDKKLKDTLRKCLVKEAFDVAYSDDFLTGFNKDSTEAGLTLFIKGHRQTLIRLGKSPCHATVSHEIFHAVMLLMKFLRMPLSLKNDEAYAYLIGYITEQFYTNIS